MHSDRSALTAGLLLLSATAGRQRQIFHRGRNGDAIVKPTASTTLRCGESRMPNWRSLTKDSLYYATIGGNRNWTTVWQLDRRFWIFSECPLNRRGQIFWRGLALDWILSIFVRRAIYRSAANSRACNNRGESHAPVPASPIIGWLSCAAHLAGVPLLACPAVRTVIGCASVNTAGQASSGTPTNIQV